MPTLLNTVQVGALFGVNKRAVLWWIEQGGMEAIKLPSPVGSRGSYRIVLEQLETVLDTRLYQEALAFYQNHDTTKDCYTPPLLTQKEVARLLKVDRKTVRRWDQSGLIRSLLSPYSNGNRKYLLYDLEKFVAAYVYSEVVQYYHARKK